MRWPAVDQNAWQMIQVNPVSEQVPQSAKALVDGELSKCDPSTGFVPDLHVFDQLYVNHPRYRSLLRNLYWRTRRQSAIWQIFRLLLHRAFTDPECLHLPVGFDQSSASDTIMDLLKCSSRHTTPMRSGTEISHCRVLNGRNTSSGKFSTFAFLSLGTVYMVPRYAVMIVRGGEDFTSIFSLIQPLECSGTAIPSGWTILDNSTLVSTFYENPNDCVLAPKHQRFNQKFGLRLPHGLEPEQLETQFSECERHLGRIERAV